MKRLLLVLGCCCLLLTVCQAQKKTSTAEFLPKGRFFKSLYLDPLEAQTYGSMALFWQGDERQNLIYGPFAFGFYRSIVRWPTDTGGLEFGLDLGSYTQFEFTQNNGESFRHLLNSDFKISLLVSYLYGDWAFRLRSYHISSHWGDDFIIKNNITEFTENPVNYEQTDFTVAWQKRDFRPYAGVGMVIRPKTVRRRFSAQAGSYFSKSLNLADNIRWVGGADFKIMAQNDFHTNSKLATGAEFGKRWKNPVRILLEYYTGHLPYSVFEYRYVQWVGIGLYMDPI